MTFRVADRLRGCSGAQTQCKPGAKPVIVTIIDSCPGCSFNIPVPLFATLADPVVGVLPVAYQQARPPLSASALLQCARVRLRALLPPVHQRQRGSARHACMVHQRGRAGVHRPPLLLDMVG